MKSPSLLSLALLSALTAGAFAQGSLIPPAGSPAPVYKTLDQVEARTPLVAGQPGVSISATGSITISQAGSYYLTKNLTVTTGNAININVSDVTVDLNGFTVSSSASAASGTGVFLANALQNITITNGHIRGSATQTGGVFTGGGLNSGIHYLSIEPTNTRVSKISVSGCMMAGIYLGVLDRSNTVESCVVHTVGEVGIVAYIIKDSSAMECRLSGIVSKIASNSKGQSFDSTGVNGDIIQNCTGIGKGYGILATHSVTNSYGESTAGNPGIQSSGTVSYCRGKSLHGFAINCSIAIGCTTAGGNISAVQKHLGTP